MIAIKIYRHELWSENPWCRVHTSFDMHGQSCDPEHTLVIGCELKSFKITADTSSSRTTENPGVNNGLLVDIRRSYLKFEMIFS